MTTRNSEDLIKQNKLAWTRLNKLKKKLQISEETNEMIHQNYKKNIAIIYAMFAAATFYIYNTRERYC
tara:strand:+ start:288 stop:491 length:204 start_codon:yes stop_codon:yes gene_type:complete